MSDTPMTPEDRSMTTEEVVARIQEGRDVPYACLAYAAGFEYDRAKALAALVYELVPDARRWRAVRESARSTTVSWGTNDPAHSGSRTEWQITAWLHGDTIDEAADRLADKEGT
jgi:hypothetical protein